MSPIIMDLPPAAIGHNSQACEVRPAQVSKVNSDRNAFLDMAVQDGIDERQRILHYAAAYMGHAQFHTFYLMMHHGSKYGDGVTVGQRRIAGIMECSERHVRRIMDELEGDGWFERREKRRDARSGKIPDAVMQPLAAELIDLSKKTGQGIVVPAAMVPQHIDRTPASNRTPMSGSTSSNRTPMSGSTSSNRTPMSGSQTAPEPRTGHSWPNEPDIPVHITKEDKPNTAQMRAHAHTHTHTREELDHLRKRLLEAGGPAINEAHAGFLVMADPIRWLDGGCDLEMDIVPAVQKTVAAAAKRGTRLMGWAYFSEAVQDARDRRLVPMDKPAARAVSSQANGSYRQCPPTPQDGARAIMREILAREAAGKRS